MQKFQSSGLWYLPGQDSKPVAGTLRYSRKDGLRLSLTGTFAEMNGPAALQDLFGSLQSPKYPLILGVVSSSPYGKKVSLMDCFQSRRSLAMPGLSTEEVYANRGFVGDALIEDPGQTFTGAQAQFTHLADWFGSRSFAKEWVRGEGKFTGLRVEFHLPEDISVTVDDKTWVFSSSLSVSDTGHELRLADAAAVSIGGLGNASQQDIVGRYIYPLQNFFTLATDAPNALEDLVLTSERLRSPDGRFPASLHFLFQRTFAGKKRANSPHPIEMLLSYADVADAFGSVLNSWMAFSREFDQFCNVFFGLLYNPPKFLDMSFLQLYAALNLFIQQSRLPAGSASRALEPMRKQLLGAVPQEQGEWLSHLLPSDTEVDFPEHFQGLLKQHAGVMRPLVGENLAAFIDQVIFTRTYALRRESNLAGKALGGADLHWMMEKLFVLLKACILTRLGFAEDRVLSLFEHTPRYIHLKGVRPEKA